MSQVLVMLSAILIASSSARPQDVSISPHSYTLSFASDDGVSRDEFGELKNPGTADEEWAVQGEFAWVDPNGTLHRTTYTADKNGYRPREVPDDLLPGVARAPQLSVKAALSG